jgi:hypothetical protein
VVQVGEVLDVREVDPLLLAELPDVGGRVRALVLGLEVELAAAVVDRVLVVVGDALAAQVEVGALEPAGDRLWAGLVDRVLERLPLVVGRDAGAAPRAERQQPGDAENSDSFFHDNTLI